MTVAPRGPVRSTGRSRGLPRQRRKRPAGGSARATSRRARDERTNATRVTLSAARAPPIACAVSATAMDDEEQPCVRRRKRPLEAEGGNCFQAKAAVACVGVEEPRRRIFGTGS